MAAAANYAWVNRAMMTFLTRRAFAKQFGKTAEELDMHLVYDVSHNIAKVRQYSSRARPTKYETLWKTRRAGFIRRGRSSGWFHF